jgi:hypothetical protein
MRLWPEIFQYIWQRHKVDGDLCTRDSVDHLKKLQRRAHEEGTCDFHHCICVHAPVRGASRQRAGWRRRPGNAKKASPKKGSAGSATLTGCLSGPNNEGVYELKSSKKEVEVGGLDDLSKHVGHKVRLHGSWTKNGSDIGEKESSESKGKEEKGERHFKVASIDHISDTCAAKASEKGEHHKKGTSQPSATTPKQ